MNLHKVFKLILKSFALTLQGYHFHLIAEKTYSRVQVLMILGLTGNIITLLLISVVLCN